MPKKRNSGRGSWKKERASVTNKGKTRPRSNKYRPSADSSKRPAPGTRTSYWRGGYTKKDGTKVKGHYVKNPYHRRK